MSRGSRLALAVSALLSAAIVAAVHVQQRWELEVSARRRPRGGGGERGPTLTAAPPTGRTGSAPPLGARPLTWRPALPCPHLRAQHGAPPTSKPRPVALRTRT